MLTENILVVLDTLRHDIRTLGLSALHDKFGINAKGDDDHIILDYDQITVDWNYAPSEICRGLILDARDLSVVSLGLFKFRNLGEHRCDVVNWDKVKVLEKLDGSMVNRFFSPRTQQWEYSTRYQLPRDLERNHVGDFGMTWRQLIDKCVMCLGDIAQEKHQTLTLEVMSPYNKIVVDHKQFSSRIIAMRDNITLDEIDITNHPFAPKSFAFANAEEISAFAKTLKGTECEGFVAVSLQGPHFARVKIKGENYVYLHRLKDGLNSMKNVLLLARSNDSEEVLLHFPEYQEQVVVFEKTIADFITRHEAAYERFRHLESQKDFALTIQKLDLEYPAALFSTRAGKAPSIREAIMKMNDTAFVKMFRPIVQKLTRYVIDEE